MSHTAINLIREGELESNLAPSVIKELLALQVTDPKVKRKYTGGAWRWHYENTSQPPPVSVPVKETPTSEPVVEERTRTEIQGLYSHEDVTELSRIVNQGQDLTSNEMITLVDTALYLYEAMAELKHKTVAPLDHARAALGVNFMGKVYYLQADFDDDHETGTKFYLQTMNTQGMMSCLWEDNTRFEMEFDWIHSIESVE